MVYGVQVDPDVMSLLEENAVLPSTNEIYAVPVNEFMAETEKQGIKLKSDEEIDKNLVKKLNRDYLKGYEVSRANHLLAGWLHFFPEFSKTGKRRIPRAWRALKGWKRLAPPSSRKHGNRR